MRKWMLGIFSLFWVMDASAYGQAEKEQLTKRFNLGEFDGIINTTSADLIISRGNSFSIEAEASQEFLSRLELQVQNGNLRIKTKSIRFGIGRDLGRSRIYITLPALETLKLTGSGNAHLEDVFEGESFNLNITGSGDADMILEADTLDATLTGSGDALIQGSFGSGEIRITGSGNMELEGFMDQLNATLTGSGDLKASNLQTANADLTITGSGNINVNIEDELSARITGSGDIHYSGNPRLGELRTTGSGNISGRD